MLSVAGPLRFLRKVVFSVPFLVTMVLLLQIGLYVKSAPQRTSNNDNNKNNGGEAEKVMGQVHKAGEEEDYAKMKGG